MRFLLLRGLVVLLSLALVGGNAHAALGPEGSAASDPCVETQAHQHVRASDEADQAATHRDKAHHDDHGCCCECLGCTTAMDVTPGLMLAPDVIPFRIRFDHRTVALGTRAPDPELDPPRLIALI